MKPSDKQSSVARKLGLALLSLAVTLVIAELIVRQFVENPITDIERTRYGWKAHGFRPDEQLHYSFAPGTESRMVLPENYDVAFRISAQGIRDDVVYARGHPGTLRILLLGDSFVFGVGVELEDTIGKLLERDLREDPAWPWPTEVVAVGCPSYGLDSYAMLIERWRPLVEPDLVIIAICPGNDLIDYEQKQADPRAVVEGYIVSLHTAWSYRLRKVSTLAHMALERFNPHPRYNIERPAKPTAAQLAQLLDTMRPWIARAVDACGPDGPPLAVTLMEGGPAVAALRKGRPGFSVPPMREVIEEFAARGATILDPRPAWAATTDPPERYFHATDAHYSALGSRVVARYLAGAVRDAFSGLLPP
jgi:hypothetical protein